MGGSLWLSVIIDLGQIAKLKMNDLPRMVTIAFKKKILTVPVTLVVAPVEGRHKASPYSKSLS